MDSPDLLARNQEGMDGWNLSRCHVHLLGNTGNQGYTCVGYVETNQDRKNHFLTEMANYT